MIDCVAIIPAKGHSRRLPGKNLRLCAGKTLVERGVECARESGIFSDVVVSSEDHGILRDMRRISGVSLHTRDPRLSEDGVGVATVVACWLGCQWPMPDAFCVLWPTTPTRTPEVLRAMGERFTGSEESSLHSARLQDFGLTHGHEGTAIFMRTLYFLQRLTLDLKLGDPVFLVENSVDVNTAEDLARAEAIILAREAACPSSS